MQTKPCFSYYNIHVLIATRGGEGKHSGAAFLQSLRNFHALSDDSPRLCDHGSLLPQCHSPWAIGQWLLRWHGSLCSLQVQESQDFSGGPGVKNPPASAGDMSSIPGPGRSHMLWSNLAHVPQLLSPCSTIREATTTRGLCTATREWPPLVATR